MILAAVIASLVFASLSHPSERVQRYLTAQIYGSVALFSVNFLWHDTSPIYGAAYTIVTAVILWTVLAIVAGTIRQCQNSFHGPAFVGLCAWALALVCYFHIEHPRFYDLLGIAEGAILFWAGATIGFLASYLESQGIAYTLSGLWLAQSAFRIYFYVLNASPLMVWLNWKLPPLLGITAFLLIGWIGRRQFAFRRLLVRRY